MGKEFDALVIDVYAPGGPIDECSNTFNGNIKEYNEALVQRFLYSGDDRNIRKVFVKGCLIKNDGDLVM